MDFATHWNRVLQTGNKSATDIITSVSEDAINRYLSEHHANDTSKYKFEFERIFSTQPERSVKVTVKVEDPLAIDLPGFAALQPPFTQLFGPNGWIDVEEKDVSGNLPSPNPFLKAADNANNLVTLRLFCRRLSFKLRWNKLSVPGQYWEWTPPPIAVAAEATLELYQENSRWFMRIMPTRIKFEKATPMQLRKAARDAYKTLSKQHKGLLDDPEEKFYDLLLIALNVVGTEYAPRMVKNIEIPVTTIQEKRVSPSFFNASDNILTIGAALDTTAIVTESQAIFEREFAKLRTYIQDDIDAKGGLEAMMLKPSPVKRTSPKDLAFRPVRDVEKDFVRTNDYLRRLEAEANDLHLPPARRPKRGAAASAVVAEGLAAGVNEYLFETLVNGVLPGPKSECSDWESILSLVRGRTCHWSDIHGFDLAINGTNLTGSINIRVGGALEGCVRKFWDCSWHWSCTKITLGVRGTPSVTLRLVADNKGVAFYGQIGGSLELETNLPFPFGDIVKFFAAIIKNFVVAFVNLILSFIKFRVLLNEITIPDQRTKLLLSNFRPFPFDRTQPAGLPPERLKFIGYKADVDAGK